MPGIRCQVLGFGCWTNFRRAKCKGQKEYPLSITLYPLPFLLSDTRHLTPIFQVPGHSQICPTAGSAAIVPEPDARRAILPTFQPLRRHKMSRKGRIGNWRVVRAKGKPGKSESAPKRKVLRNHWRRWRWSLARKQPQQFPLEGCEGNLPHGLARIHQDVPAARKLRSIQAKYFPHAASQTIAPHRFAQTDRRGDAQA